MEQPPIIQAQAAPEPNETLGRIGLYMSLAPLAMVALMMLAKPG